MQASLKKIELLEMEARQEAGVSQLDQIDLLFLGQPREQVLDTVGDGLGVVAERHAGRD